MAGDDQDGSYRVLAVPVPARAFSVVEHPCIVKNIDKGIASLGGEVRLSRGLTSQKPVDADDEVDGADGALSVSLRPDDPFAKRLLSHPVDTSNLLLKVTVPRRTGRRRKRGSSGPFVDASDASGVSSKTPYVPASTVYRSIRDNSAIYAVTPLGIIDDTNRFRKLPDLQYAASRDDMMQNIMKNLVPLRYSQIRDFSLNVDAGADHTKPIPPSAEFLRMPVQYNYRARQNQFVKYVGKNRKPVNIAAKLFTHGGYYVVKPTATYVPEGPKSHLPPESVLPPALQEIAWRIRAELAKRPIITRHLLYNIIGWNQMDRIREAAVYCGYFFESGPWRETLIQFGLDPRTDPKYRHYQTISFLSYLKTGSARHLTRWDAHIRSQAEKLPGELKHEHLFDGVHVSTTGNLYQFCDITDPVVRKILDTKDIRTTCAPTFAGWYHAGTWAKATVIMKDRMNTILGGESPNDALYQRLSTWPELWDDAEMSKECREGSQNFEVSAERARELVLMQTVRAAARNPRYAFDKLEKQQQDEEQDAERNEMDEDPEVPEDMTEEPSMIGPDEAFLNDPQLLTVDSESGEDEDDDEDDDDGEDEDAWLNDEDSDSDGPTFG
ncbi:hypothetical protein EJ04DRAFT_497877 [Polyplosphaeria fusca]|uniref:Uncharacterized protein n=1 Tax=Polyplosphaeria fusca TaxID=682080 RepID=A0A9P4QQJ5_9PLEO|nr:hypothetical protein EJ04DRAFT_497877 [Polyplosphaeria fusca]